MVVTCSPHIRDNASTQSIMRDVLIALVPALIASVWVFGFSALLRVIVCVIFAVGSEYLFEKACGRPITISDYSAAVTGVLLAYNLPPELPLWMAAFGSIVAIVAVKQLFGGIGHNFANPAITARIVLLISFAGPMTTWVIPDTVSGATPLGLIAAGELEKLPPVTSMFLGTIGGCLGETSALALLLGFAYLLYRKVITWHIPVFFVGTVFVLTALAGYNPVYQVLAGGLLLGAIFMATDYSTSPLTVKGQIIYAIGCGFITFMIRIFGNYPEGVSFSILLMNIIAPHITNLTLNKPLGRCLEMSNAKNDFVLPIVVLTVICIVVSLALAFTEQATAPIIAAAEKAAAEAAEREVLPSADSFELVQATGLPDGVTEVYRATNGAGFVFMVEGKGYGGTVKGIVGIDADGIITGTKILSHSETPSLGGKTAEEPFQSQFPGKDSTLSGVSVISGASVSSRCFIGMVTQAFSAYDIVKGA